MAFDGFPARLCVYDAYPKRRSQKRRGKHKKQKPPTKKMQIPVQDLPHRQNDLPEGKTLPLPIQWPLEDDRRLSTFSGWRLQKTKECSQGLTIQGKVLHQGKADLQPKWQTSALSFQWEMGT